MNFRDKLLTGLAIFLTALGVFLSLLVSVEVGIVVLFVMVLLLCFIVLLQRKHTARLQQRILTLIQLEKEAKHSTSLARRHEIDTNKKIFGHLQAQQVSLD